jgi:hypothetical protein
MTFWILAMISVLCLIYVAQKTLYVIIGTEFGNKIPIYIAMLSSIVFQFVGIVVWASVSEADFTGCDEESDDYDEKFNL